MGEGAGRVGEEEEEEEERSEKKKENFVDASDRKKKIARVFVVLKIQLVQPYIQRKTPCFSLGEAA